MRCVAQQSIDAHTHSTHSHSLTDVYLASGIFNALLKFVHRIDVWLASDARSSIGPEHLLLAFETRSVAWTCFLRVIQPSVENSAGLRDSPPHQRFTIAASVGHTLVLSTKQLLAAVKHAFRTHSTLDKQDAGMRESRCIYLCVRMNIYVSIYVRWLLCEYQQVGGFCAASRSSRATRPMMFC
jgi:hypothetical protein